MAAGPSSWKDAGADAGGGRRAMERGEQRQKASRRNAAHRCQWRIELQQRGMVLFMLSWVLILTTCCARGACSGERIFSQSRRAAL